MLNTIDSSQIRTMTSTEAAEVETRWVTSDECKKLRERQRLLTEDLAEKTGSYSRRA